MSNHENESNLLAIVIVASVSSFFAGKHLRPTFLP